MNKLKKKVEDYCFTLCIFAGVLYGYISENMAIGISMGVAMGVALDGRKKKSK